MTINFHFPSCKSHTQLHNKWNILGPRIKFTFAQLMLQTNVIRCIHTITLLGIFVFEIDNRQPARTQVYQIIFSRIALATASGPHWT